MLQLFSPSPAGMAGKSGRCLKAGPMRAGSVGVSLGVSTKLSAVVEQAPQAAKAVHCCLTIRHPVAVLPPSPPPPINGGMASREQELQRAPGKAAYINHGSEEEF